MRGRSGAWNLLPEAGLQLALWSPRDGRFALKGLCVTKPFVQAGGGLWAPQVTSQCCLLGGQQAPTLLPGMAASPASKGRHLCTRFMSVHRLSLLGPLMALGQRPGLLGAQSPSSGHMNLFAFHTFTLGSAQQMGLSAPCSPGAPVLGTISSSERTVQCRVTGFPPWGLAGCPCSLG